MQTLQFIKKILILTLAIFTASNSLAITYTQAPKASKKIAFTPNINQFSRATLFLAHTETGYNDARTRVAKIYTNDNPYFCNHVDLANICNKISLDSIASKFTSPYNPVFPKKIEDHGMRITAF